MYAWSMQGPEWEEGESVCVGGCKKQVTERGGDSMER